MTESQSAQRVTDWMRLYAETAYLGQNWQANCLFNEGCQDLTDRLHKVRQQYDPLDADNEMAKVEQRIRRALAYGPKTLRELQQNTNARRTGIWIWKSALDNLIQNDEVFYDPKSKTYTLNEEV